MQELRLIEILLPKSHTEELNGILEDHEHHLHRQWEEPVGGDQRKFKLVVSQPIEPLLDAMEKRFKSVDEFSMIVTPVEAVIPRIQEKEVEEGAAKESYQQSSRISREELYRDIGQSSHLSLTFVIMAALSTIVAAIGLLQGNLAVIIGAMVIAPLLGPNIALSLATTLADFNLAKTAFRANITGLLISIGLPILIGVFYTVDPDITSMALQTEVGPGNIILALAAGTAGTLAFTSGYAPSVIGVMVAVALLPPAVAVGLLLGDGHYHLALNAFLLLLINIIGINLSGVVTFLWQGIRPLTWWEEQKAKRATRISILLWGSLLVVLVVVVLLAYQY